MGRLQGLTDETTTLVHLHLAVMWGLRCRIDTRLIRLDGAPRAWTQSSVNLLAARARVRSEAEEEQLEWAEPTVYDGMIALAESLSEDHGWSIHESIAVIAQRGLEHGVPTELVTHLGTHS